MVDGASVVRSSPNGRHASIRAKILFALLLLSLLPLILFVALSLYGITNAEGYIRRQLILESQKDVFRLVKVQAAVANAVLDKIEVETQLIARAAQVLLRNPNAFGHATSPSAEEIPQDREGASKYVLAPGVSVAAAQPVLDLTGNLDALFAMIKKEDRNLEQIYVGMEPGIYRRYPWDDDSMETFEFVLDSNSAPTVVEDGSLVAPLRQAFDEHGFKLSPQATVTTTVPGKQWAIHDAGGDKSFYLKREETGLAVYAAYDPRNRPWYRAAIGRSGVAWTKYPQWGGGNFSFSLGKESATGTGDLALGDKVSPKLVEEFAQHSIGLVAGSPISVTGVNRWALRDKNDNNYEIRLDNSELNVYDLDILTSSRAVLDPNGRVAGVVGLDINMDAIRKRIIHTPDEVEGFAFLLNDKGELIDQERPDMFVPPVGGEIRAKMTAGEVGHVYDAQDATYVFYAPIPSITSTAGKSVWSVGMSVPESTVTRLAKDTQRRLFYVLELGALVFVIVMPFPLIFAAVQTARGIAKPIQQLGNGVKRIGGGNLNYRLKVKTNDEIEELADAFNKMADDLQSYIADLKKTTAEKERFESELRVAHDIQMSFLKKIFPPFPDREDFSLFAWIKPAREVGGDLYDFALLNESQIFFYIGDVADKGVPASLIMAITMTLMKRASLQPGITPAGILRQVNLTLAEGNENVMFVTLFVGIFNMKTGELVFSNAGHNPPAILTAAGECRYLALPDGLVVGVIPDTKYSDATIVLERGDMIVTYTDGVTEAMNPAEDLYSERRLEETLVGLKGRSVADTVAAIFASVKAHAAGAPQSDDIAVLAVRRN